MKQPLKADIVRTYGRYAPYYDLLFGAVLQPGRKALAKEIQKLSPTSLLEVGVGTGLTLLGYQTAMKVVGVDLSDDMLDLARQRIKSHRLSNVELLRVDGESLPFPNSSFDCVTLPYVLSVTPDPAQLLSELRRVCKPSGTILILNHFSGSRTWWLLERLVKGLADRVGFRSDFRYEDHIEAHGLPVRSVQSVNLFGLSKLVIATNA